MEIVHNGWGFFSVSLVLIYYSPNICLRITAVRLNEVVNR